MSRIGQYANADKFIRADGRSKVAKVMKSYRQALVEHIGGEPNAVERAIIDLAVVKMVRLELGQRKAIADAETQDTHNWLSWSESLRRDLLALGVSARSNEPLTLHEYIRLKDAG